MLRHRGLAAPGQSKTTRNDSLTIKAAAAAALTVLALILLFLVGDLVDEHRSRERQVVREIGAVWGVPSVSPDPVLRCRTHQPSSMAVVPATRSAIDW